MKREMRAIIGKARSMEWMIGILAIGLLLLAFANARAASYGQASDLFQVGAGARSMAMGGAFTGLSDDASAPYFNPSGLAFLDEHQLMAMHAPLFIDSNYNYIASAHPFGDKWGSAALSDALLLSDGFQLRDKFNNVTNSNGSLRNNAIFASYAHKLPWNFAAGANVKMIQQKIAEFSDSAMGMDVGFMFRPNRMFSAGASFANVNSPEVKLRNSADVFRPLSRFGVASEVFEDRLLLTADVTKLAQQGSLYAAGFEFTANKLVQIRGGFNANRSYTFGLGIKLKPFHIDYAFSDTDLGAFNKVSFTWAWHNIYKTDVEPPLKEGRAIYPLSGFENSVAFRTAVPGHVVARWSLMIKNPEGKVVRTLQGDLRPPETIVWDARNTVGEPVVDGTYQYDFLVNYKNGKSWNVGGQLDLRLPQPKVDDADMNLQLNGGGVETEEN